MTGWWGPEPPYHAPVFVLTHHGYDPIQMDGGTTFHFITAGFDAAYFAACQAAGDNGVDIAGGASTVRQALAAGVIDELTLDIAPVLLGSGDTIFDGAETFALSRQCVSLLLTTTSASPRQTTSERCGLGSRTGPWTAGTAATPGTGCCGWPWRMPI